MATTVVHITRVHHAFDQVAALFDEYRQHYGRPPSPDLTRDWLHNQLAHRRLTIEAALHADQVCGFITITVMPASLALGTAWSIRDLFVAPKHRRRGIARILLRHAIDEARAAGAGRVSLQTETGNTAALTLYSEAGFQPVRGLEVLNLAIAPHDQQKS